jgi:hypothetical protein
MKRHLTVPVAALIRLAVVAAPAAPQAILVTDGRTKSSTLC